MISTSEKMATIEGVACLAEAPFDYRISGNGAKGLHVRPIRVRVQPGTQYERNRGDNIVRLLRRRALVLRGANSVQR